MSVIPISLGHSFISFNSSAMEVSWYTNSRKDEGVYTISITGLINSTSTGYFASATKSFTLIVTASECKTSLETV